MRLPQVTNPNYHDIPEPEKNLLINMLKRAALDFCSSDKNISNDARMWIEYPCGKEELWSFRWVSYMLGYDHNEMRKAIIDNRIGLKLMRQRRTNDEDCS